jgi:hypothetical protein
MEDLMKEATPSDVKIKSPLEKKELPAKRRKGNGMRKEKGGRFM